MADPTLFSWSGTDYRSSESFGDFLHILLPNGTLLECDAVTGGAPVNLQLAVTDDEGDRAVAFEIVT